MFSFLLLGLALALNPSCSDDKNLEPAPEAVNIKVSNYAMLYETVHVNTTNVASGTTVTVNFGEGTVVEGKSGMEISHTYTRPGHYTITMEADGYITSTKDIEVGSKPGISEELKCLKDPDNKKVFVAAHRSHTSDTSIPDNSLRAVEAAIAAGTDFIETDVWCTTDGVIVVNHDFDILCNDGEKVDIRKVKYERIKGTRLIDRHTGKFSENPADVLPTLEEFLNAGRGRVFYSLDKIEYNPSVSYIVKEVERLGMIESVYFYAGGNPQTITTILEINPHAHVGIWSGNIVPFRNYPDGIFYSQGDYLPSKGFDTNLHPDIAEGIFPWINYLGVHDEATTENSLNEAHLDAILAEYPSLAFIQCDVPDLMIPALKKRGRR